ncbi:MAG: NADH-quinone oxidoreductase subunit L [Fimbriimonas sp.]
MNSDFRPAIAILILPLLGFLVQVFMGKTLRESYGRRVAAIVAVLPVALAFAASVSMTMKLSTRDPSFRAIGIDYFNWIELKNFSAPFGLLVDPLSMTMALIITGVGSLIFVYATAYMAEDRDFSRFFSYMNLFVAAMLLLVLGNNLLMLFIGWEGVGLCSYLLIGFWYKDLPNARAANKAFIVNRIGDWALMLALFLIVAALVTNSRPVPFHNFLTYDVMQDSLSLLLMQQPVLATSIALLLFVGAAGKSAQFPLYLWLPDAMAGPTPVSALIHAATMVTSGVFLVNRMHFVFEASPIAGAVMCVVGAFTAAFAAIIAFGQTDIKRVLAYSTVSQLGFMFIACGAGAYWAGMFHVTTHAFFKALLFLGAGAVIHAMSHNQDMRNYGGLFKYMKITAVCMIAGWLAISGFPFTSGFFSKEAILGSALGTPFANAGGVQWAQVSGWIGLGVAFLTAVYMTRMMSLTFAGKEERWRAIPADVHPHGQELHATAEESPALADDRLGFYYTADEMAVRAEEEEHHHELAAGHEPREVPATMWVPLVILAVLSVVSGFLLKDQLFAWLYPLGNPVTNKIPHEPHGIPLLALSIAAALGGLLAGWFFYSKGLPKNQGWEEGKWQGWRRAAQNQFGFDYLATTTAIDGGGEIGRGLWRYVDQSFLDRVVNGVGAITSETGGFLKRAQTGYVRLYALVMLVGGVAFVGYFLFVISSIGGGK